MALSFKKVFSNTILGGGILLSAVYLVACLTPYISPVYFSPFTILAIGFPILLACMFLWLLIALLFYRRISWIFFFVVLLGYKNIFNCIGFNPKKEFKQEKEAGVIRIMSWNVADFVDSQIYTDTPGNVRRDMMKLIADTKADVLCIQDFTDREQPGYKHSLQDVIDAGKYPYYYFSVENTAYDPSWTRRYGTALFSKTPIIDSGKIGYTGKLFQGALAYIDIKHGNDTVRVYGTHLQSMYLKMQIDPNTTYDYLENDSTIILKEKSIIKKLHYFDKKHIVEATIAKNEMNKCKKPFVFCADLNAVPSSYVYNKIKDELNDAFLDNCFGLGQTYDGISPTLRIDVVLTSKELKTTQYYSPRLHASDHFPIITDVKLK